MPTTTPLSANAAYISAISKQAEALGDYSGLVTSIAPEARTPESPFFQAVRSAAQQAIEAQKSAEAISYSAIRGEASLSELIPAVLQAETTLNTIVAVRDRLVGAYQEILRLPI